MAVCAVMTRATPHTCKQPVPGRWHTPVMGACRMATRVIGRSCVQEELGITLEKATEEVFGVAGKVTVGKEACVIVGDGQHDEEIAARVGQIKNMIAATEQDYEREKLNERVARLSGGVAVLQVGAQTETELKEKKLRVEDALNATKAAVEEGIVVGGGCTLVQLAGMVDAVKEEVRPPLPPSQLTLNCSPLTPPCLCALCGTEAALRQ